MKRKKNKDRLSSGFYQAHSFLNFDMKAHNQNTGPLEDINLLGINLPGVLRYSNEMDEVAKKNLNIYANFCAKEYDSWMDCLKFQFEASLLHEILPPKQILNDFFGDLHIRVPHEKTLLVCNHPSTTTVMSVEEVTTNKFIKRIKNRMQKSIYATNSEARKCIKQIKDWQVDSVLLCRLTFAHQLTEKEIYKPKRFKKKTLETITRPVSVHYPISIIYPCGLSIKETELSLRPMIFEDAKELRKTEDNSLFQAILSPYATKPIEGHYLRWDHTEEETIKDKVWKLMNKRWNIDDKDNYHDIRATLCRVALQTLVHISVLTHPDFKQFCVNMLKKDGLQPHKNPYNSKNPYSKRPNFKPPFEHYMVTINIPDEVSSEKNSSVNKKRYHLVRGHLMKTHSDNSIDGFVWRKSHWRGNRELGTVTKDYTMNIDERIY
jgi:hypothetical protein